MGRERTHTLHMYQPWPAPTYSASGGNVPRRRGYAGRVVLVRTADTAAAIPAIRAAVWSIDKNQPIDKVVLVEDAYVDIFGRQRFVLQLMTAFGAVAVLLTAVGLFDVLSQIVVRKTREIGIRIALGARPSDVLNLVLRRGLAFTLGGAAIGLAGAFALTRFLEALLFQGAAGRSDQLRDGDPRDDRDRPPRVVASRPPRNAGRGGGA